MCTVYMLYLRLCLTLFIHVACFLEFFHCCVSLCCVFYNIHSRCLFDLEYLLGLFFISVSLVLLKTYHHFVCLISSGSVHYCFFVVSLCVVLNMILTNSAYIKAIFSCNYQVYKSLQVFYNPNPRVEMV